MSKKKENQKKRKILVSKCTITQSIGFHDELSIRNPMNENESRGEYLLERVESITTGEVKLPRNVLLGKVYQ